MLYEPQGYAPEELKRHGEMIAERLGLTSEQVRCLVPELRNAIAPAVMGMGKRGPRTEEDVLDIRHAFARIVALANALAEKANKKSMEAGVVFDWHLAARMIRVYGAHVARAAVPHVASVLIWKDGEPTPRESFKFAGVETLELHIGDEVWNCYVAKTDRPDWNEETYWPESALAIVRGTAK